MKQRISILIVIVLALATVFIGCGTSPESKTEVVAVSSAKSSMEKTTDILENANEASNSNETSSVSETTKEIADETASVSEIETSEKNEIAQADKEEADEQDDNIAEETIEEFVAEGSEIIGGTWKVGGIVYRNFIIDVHDVEGIEDLYDTTMLTFNEDGTFVYLKTFNDRGTWSKKDKGGETSFILKTESTFRYEFVDGELAAVDTESSDKKQYIATILDENTFVLNEYDSLTGKAKANDDPLYFVKQKTESQYIADNKATIDDSSSEQKEPETSKPSAQPSGNSSYQAILDEYTTKMENAVGGLVREYQSEAAGISDIYQLAEICNEKVGELAEICNEGVGEMAELMYANGDSYETYEKWATKLMDNYSDIAMEIQDAYLDSATY